jgi:hypothetical protein
MKGAESDLEGHSTPQPISEAEPALEIPGIDPEDLDDIKSVAKTVLQRGGEDFDDLIEYLRDSYEVKEDGASGLTDLAEYVLQQLILEQSEWPDDELDDMKKLTRAFRALERKGVVSRACFSCCSRCGNGEIRAEASSGDVGYCYFHEQDVDSCIQDRGLVLRHGVIGDNYTDMEKRAANARVLVQTMEEVGLPVEWNQDPERVVELPGFKWRVRLHDGSEGSKEEQGEVDKENIGEDEGTDLGIPSLDFYVR